MPVNLTHQRESIHFGHLRVQQQQLERLLVRDGFLQFSKRLFTAGYGCGLHFPASQQLGENAAVGGIVVDDQYTQTT